MSRNDREKMYSAAQKISPPHSQIAAEGQESELWRLSANIEAIILLSRKWVGTFHLDGSVRASRGVPRHGAASKRPPRGGLSEIRLNCFSYAASAAAFS